MAKPDPTTLSQDLSRHHHEGMHKSTVLLQSGGQWYAAGEGSTSEAKARTDYAVGFSGDDAKQLTAGSSPVPDGWPASSNAIRPAKDGRTSHTALGRPTHGQHYGNRLALIIDDDEVARLVVAQCVEPLGYKVTLLLIHVFWRDFLSSGMLILAALDPCELRCTGTVVMRGRVLWLPVIPLSGICVGEWMW